MSDSPHDRHDNDRGKEDPPDPALAHAEELVDRMGERVGHFLSQAGRQAQKAAARAREEAEDIWAEAQHLRHNGRS